VAQKLIFITVVQAFIWVLSVGFAFAETVRLEWRHGVYLVPVLINGAITLPFLIDTGAADVAIPTDVFLTLIRTGTVKESDSIGTGRYVLADGSEQSSERFILHEVRLGNYIVNNVVANVVPVKGDPLLGQSFLSKLPAWTIENERHALVLFDKSSPTAPVIPNTFGIGNRLEAEIVSDRNHFTKSLNGTFGYFLSERRATSDEVNQINLVDGTVRFVIDGNSIQVIRSGKFAGYLLVARHRYRTEGGSYECV
jgi:hypothetical protein